MPICVASLQIVILDDSVVFNYKAPFFSKLFRQALLPLTRRASFDKALKNHVQNFYF